MRLGFSRLGIQPRVCRPWDTFSASGFCSGFAKVEIGVSVMGFRRWLRGGCWRKKCGGQPEDTGRQERVACLPFSFFFMGMGDRFWGKTGTCTAYLFCTKHGYFVLI